MNYSINMYVVLVACVCTMAIISSSVNAMKNRPHHTCEVDGYHLIEAKFGKETHLLCVQLQPIVSSPLANHQSTLLLEPETDEDSSYFKPISLSEIAMAYGFPVKDSALGSAEGYIGQDNQFYGVLHLDNRTLYADPHNIDDLEKSFGAFENDNMIVPRTRRDHTQSNHPFLFAHPSAYFPYNIEERQSVPDVARARICELLLLADKEFFEKDANSSLNQVVQRMMHSVAQADIVFRNTDFNEDGIPDNIGFSVKYLVVLTSEETNTRVFGGLSSSNVINGRDYLMRFARLRRLSEVCLGVAFSGHAFHNRTLGLSFTSLGGGMGGAAGGLCDRRAYGRSFNTLAIAHATTEGKGRVPERISALTLTHEMGHSFGAHHDDNFPNPECRGYLMGSMSSNADSVKHFEFSLCSKRLIAATLSSMSYCLIDEDKPYCGNGIVEEGEACDCGLPARCILHDPCCTPRGGGALVYEEGTLHKDGCSVAPTALCHPSQGPCCTQKCHFANLTSSGIDCTTQDLGCACESKAMDSCKCGLGGRCLSDATCHAAECARLGYRECQCRKKYTRKDHVILSDLNKCSVCCLLPSRAGAAEECVTAELAAKHYLDSNERLPDMWPDPDYHGPNQTLHLCESHVTCNMTQVRAWHPGELCVTRNMVGLCSPQGLCKLSYLTPRSNVYPDIMNIRLKAEAQSSTTTSLRPVSFVLILVCSIK